MLPLSDAIQALRGDESQERFAVRIGVTRMTLRKWEDGNSVSLDNLRALVEAGLDPAYLLGTAIPTQPRAAKTAGSGNGRAA